MTFASQSEDPFTREVKERVAGYFAEKNLSTKATAGVVVKTFVLLLVTFGSYGLILSGQFSPLVMLFLAVVMGVGIAGIGFGICHDALHDAYSTKPWVNRGLGWIFDICGASGYLWKITHNIIHHTYTNIHGVDEDLEISTFVRASPHGEWRPYHRYQQWYAFALYGLSTLNWVFMKDYKHLLRRDLGPFKNCVHPPGAVAWLIGSKLIYYSWTIVIPILVLDLAWWQFLIGFLAMNLTAGFILGIVFQLAHIVEGPEHPLTDTGGKIDRAWYLHEMATTSNFACENRFLTWYVGGLNYQVEHHLFSKVCSVHYPALRPIVQEVARKYHVPYHEAPSLFAAVHSHHLMLKRLGRSAEVT